MRMMNWKFRRSFAGRWGSKLLFCIDMKNQDIRLGFFCKELQFN